MDWDRSIFPTRFNSYNDDPIPPLRTTRPFNQSYLETNQELVGVGRFQLGLLCVAGLGFAADCMEVGIYIYTVYSVCDGWLTTDDSGVDRTKPGPGTIPDLICL